MAHIFGQLDIAGFELVTSDPATFLFPGRAIYRSDLKAAKFYDGSAWIKVMNDPVKSDTKANLDALTRAAGTILYATDLQQYFGDNGTVLSQLGGGGSSSGEINAISNPSASTDITGYTSGTSHTVARDTSNSPLSPIISTSISIVASTTAAESSTSGGYYTISTVASGLKNRKLKVEFYYSTSASQSWNVGLYSGSTKVALSTDSSAASIIPAGVTGGKFTAYFDADSSTSYTLHFTRTAGSGSTTIYLTSIILGPGIQPQGSIVTGSQTITPTYSSGWGTTTVPVFYYERHGSWMHLRGKFKSGTTSSAIAYISLPAGFTINYSALPTVANTVQVGSFYELIASGTAQSFVSGSSQFGALFADGSDTSKIYFAYRSKSDGFEQVNVSTLVNASTLTYTVDCWLPISEWAGNGTINLAQNDVEYASNSSITDADDTTSFAYGPSGSQFAALTDTRDKRVRFQTPIQTSDSIVIEYTQDSGTTWVPMSSAGLVQDYVLQNTGDYGMGSILPVNSTDIRVRFGKYRNVASSVAYGAAGAAWTTVDVDPIYKWRVKKIKSGAAVGFGIVSEFSSGLVPSTNTSFDNASATRLGLKAYLHGTTYNGGIAPTVGGDASSVTRASFIPYQMQDGSWRMRFNIRCAHTTSWSTRTTSINGITTPSYTQAITGYNDAGGNALSRCFMNSSTNTLTILYTTGVAGDAYYFGDIELASKPTWAY